MASICSPFEVFYRLLTLWSSRPSCKHRQIQNGCSFHSRPTLHCLCRIPFRGQASRQPQPHCDGPYAHKRAASRAHCGDRDVARSANVHTTSRCTMLQRRILLDHKVQNLFCSIIPALIKWYFHNLFSAKIATAQREKVAELTQKKWRPMAAIFH